MKKIYKVIDLIGILFLAVPPLILGGIIGIVWESFRQGYIEGRNRVN